VAVKVRHPGVGHAISRDFALMMFVARGVSWLPGMRRLRLEDSLKQFAAPLTEQARTALSNHNIAKAACNAIATGRVCFVAQGYHAPRQQQSKLQQCTPRQASLWSICSILPSKAGQRRT
jgi:hypothetical protein